MSDRVRAGKFLVVDDDESVRISLKEILNKHYNVLTAGSAEEALGIMQCGLGRDIELVISDICMDGATGLELLKEIKSKNSRVGVIMVTGHPSQENTVNALRFGASDFIIKPFKREDVLESVKRVKERLKEVSSLERLIEDMRVSVRKNYTATTDALIMTIDAKDNYTKEHCRRVAGLVVRFAEALGIDAEKRELLYRVSILHDIGKIGVKESVLNKAGRLTGEEWAQIKQHPFIGYQIIQPVEFLGKARDAVLYHHERYDGKGYPAGLKGKKIPFAARMMAVADSYDAMVTDRPYRKGMHGKTALEELKKGIRTQFDPELVPVFTKMIRKQKKERDRRIYN